jgi:hypothetical protein
VIEKGAAFTHFSLSRPRYNSSVSLRACPFCRELFPPRERDICPVCGVSLVAFDKMPRSDAATAEDGITDEPEWEPFPVTYVRRGRGALTALSLLGLAAFFAPWVHVTLPDVFTYSGFDMAHRIGWAWAAGVAWFVLLPIVMSRRSIMKMRGARVAASFLAAIPGMTTALLLARPPHGGHGVPVRFAFAWGLYATLAFSAVAVGVALFFGGRVDDIRVKRGTSAGQLVH